MRYNLGDYEKELAQDGFFRIHRGYLVSLRHVQSLGKHEVTLTGGVVLHVSRTKEKATERSAISVHTRGSDLMEQTQRILSSLFAFQRPRMADKEILQ